MATTQRRYLVWCFGTYPGNERGWTTYVVADRPSRAAERERKRLDREYPDMAPHHTYATLDRK